MTKPKRGFASRSALPAALRDFSLQAAGSYLTIGMQTVRGLGLALLLGPGGLGTYSLIGIFLAYSAYSDLGISLGAVREIPVAVGRDAFDDARRAQWCAWVARSAAGVVVAAGMLAFAILRWESLPLDVRFGLLAGAAAIVPFALVGVAQNVLPAWLRYGRNFALSAVLALGLTAATLAGAASWGLHGALVGQALAFVAAALLAVWLVPRALAGRLGVRYVASMLIVGAPLAALNFLGYSLVYVDQVMVGSLLGRESLGVYTLVLAAGSALYILPSAVAQAVGPRLLRRYGETEAVWSIRRLTWWPVDLLAVTMPVLAALIWVAAPHVIETLFKDYTDAVGPVRLYVTAVVFLGINLGVSTTLVALKKHAYNLPILAGVVSLNVVADLVLVGSLDLGLNGIALGSLITYFAYWMVHTTLVRHYFGTSVSRSISANLQSAWPALVLTAWTFAAWWADLLATSHSAFESAIIVTVCLSCLTQWHSVRSRDRATGRPVH